MNQKKKYINNKALCKSPRLCRDYLCRNLCSISLWDLGFLQRSSWKGRGEEKVIYLLLRLYSVGGNVWRSFGMILTDKSEVLQKHHVSGVKLFTIKPTCTGVGSNQALRIDNMGDVDKDWSSLRSDALSVYVAHGFTSYTNRILKNTLVLTAFFASLQLLYGKTHDRGYWRCLLFSALCRFTGSPNVPIYRHVCLKCRDTITFTRNSTTSFVIISLFLYQTNH
jgi:hypothetical protein